ncbi:MAG: M1 family aminopeptidase, partial [Bacteroidota bacterium]
EPDSMAFNMVVPNDLMAVGNGNLRRTSAYSDHQTLYEWFISYPINNYNISLNVADYAHFSDVYTAQDGSKLNCDYYVLKENIEKAKEHFKQVLGVLEAFEYYFGKYPFWDDGFALIETPYLGMEHQSGIAYGNKYMRGYLGGMIPKGMDWDYIIVHETGHEYWGNSISCNDHAEMWIHESFTTYMESLYVEYHFGKQKAIDYLKMQRMFIENRLPLIGPLDVNFEKFGSSDHYYKGAWILHTLRNVFNDDTLWFETLKDLHEENKLSHLTTEDIIHFFESRSGLKLGNFFEQYLHHPKPPTFVYEEIKGKKKTELIYKWESNVDDFSMPLNIGKGENEFWIYPTSNEWQTLKYKNKTPIEIRKDLFYIKTNKKT